MTMAVGFVCRDGVVIGADRQVTGTNYTFPECKLKTLKWENGHGIFAYSGSRDTYQALLPQIWARFKSDALLKYEDVQRLLKEALEASLHKKEQFFTLFGFVLEGERPQLLLTTPSLRVLNVTECEVIGYGDSPLARSLLGRFQDVPHFVSVHQARVYAVHFISEAKRYDGQYVGDGIDVYSVDHSGEQGTRCVRVLDAGQTGAWENEIRVMTYWMDVLFSDLTDKERELSLDQFMDKLRKFREWTTGDSDKNT